MSEGDTAFGVYVHWPFCAAKCPYCDFNSHVRHNQVDQSVFVDAYRREIDYIASMTSGRVVNSIFFGGGTPSMMDPHTVSTILDSISKSWALSDETEITLEANPQSVDAGKFADFRNAGVNRVSLGVQSFDDQVLRFLGRLHDSSEARNAIDIARNAFDRISFDLIYARPGQRLEQWETELSMALDLAAEHLSLYQLTIEEGTPFFDLKAKGRIVPLEEDHAAEMYELTQILTTQKGLPAYEVSNHARPGAECQHNLIYWRGQEFAGVGPGAHGRIDGSEGRIATSTVKNPEDWWQKVMTVGQGFENTSLLTHEELADELLMFGLRLSEGLDIVRFKESTGQLLDAERIDFLIQIGMLERIGNSRLRATPSGFLVLDAVVADLATAQQGQH